MKTAVSQTAYLVRLTWIYSSTEVMVQDDLCIRYNTGGNIMRDVKGTIVAIERNMKDIGLATVREQFLSMMVRLAGKIGMKKKKLIPGPDQRHDSVGCGGRDEWSSRRGTI
jgi:hypothetical protein